MPSYDPEHIANPWLQFDPQFNQALNWLKGENPEVGEAGMGGLAGGAALMALPLLSKIKPIKSLAHQLLGI
jgi:hypothetical protein